MALEHVNEHLQQQNQNQNQNQSLLLDALYCEEVDCLDEETQIKDSKSSSSLFPLLLEQDLFWEDEELISLFAKENETHCGSDNFESDPCLSEARRAAVEWILKVNSHYGFSALTAIFAINYLDRFLSGLHYQQDKPWMIQLAAVTCLSLAAKVEETEVPLLLDLQVEDAKYVFEAKTIQRMELLVLSTLKWRMNPVTPLSFLDHITRRLGLKNRLHWMFFRRCESLLLSIIADARFVRYPPSILATSTMLHVIHQVDPCKSIDYQNQLLGVLNISKEKVNNCHGLIGELSRTPPHAHNNPRKRNFNQVPSSPTGIIDAIFCSDSSNDSWEVNNKPIKKIRVSEQQMRLPSLSCRGLC